MGLTAWSREEEWQVRHSFRRVIKSCEGLNHGYFKGEAEIECGGKRCSFGDDIITKPLGKRSEMVRRMWRARTLGIVSPPPRSILIIREDDWNTKSIKWTENIVLQHQGMANTQSDLAIREHYITCKYFHLSMWVSTPCVNLTLIGSDWANSLLSHFMPTLLITYFNSWHASRLLNTLVLDFLC